MSELDFSLCIMKLEVLYVYMNCVYILFPSKYVCILCKHSTNSNYNTVTAVLMHSDTEN